MDINNNIIPGEYGYINWNEVPHGLKHTRSVNTESTTPSRKPPAPKKRRDKVKKKQDRQSSLNSTQDTLQDQINLQLQATHLLDDDNIYINSIIGNGLPTHTHEEFGPATSPSSFDGSGVSSQDEQNPIWSDKDEMPIVDTVTLQERVNQLEFALKEKEMELNQYKQHITFPTQYIKDCARQAFQNKFTDEINEDIIMLYLLQPSTSKSTDNNLTLPHAIVRFHQEWNKCLLQNSNPTDKKKNPVNQTRNNQDISNYQSTTQSQYEKLSCGSAIYISAASTTSSGVRPLPAPPQVHPDNLDLKIDAEMKWNLIEQYLNDYVPQTTSNSTSTNNNNDTSNNNTNNNNSNTNNNNNNNANNSLMDNSAKNDAMVASNKLSEAEKVIVKEAARQCFICFDGKMIIESESDRLEYLQEHCSLPPSSLSAAVECFKLELEKVRNKTKKQLLRFQNYNTEKWDQPIEKVCYLILGKDRWERLSSREKTLITGKYAYLRTNLEDLKKRNAKIKWDKLQDDFERHIKGYENNWIGLCGYWINNDQLRFERRKCLEGGSSSSSPTPSSVIPNNNNNNNNHHHQTMDNNNNTLTTPLSIIKSDNTNINNQNNTNNLYENNLPTPMSSSSPATHIPSMNTPLTPSLSVITEQDYLTGHSPCLDPFFT
ncbi:unnamed protein product [Cunninghamella blakesleeana]